MLAQLELRFRAPATSESELQAQAAELLRALDCEPLAKKLRVRWNRKMRTTAGTAHYGSCLISLNPLLVNFGEIEIATTLRHELAHLVAKYRAGRRRIAPHGSEWQQACAELGIAGEKRCHQLPLPRRPLAPKLFYRCPSCKIEIKRVRPFRRKVACLACCRAYSHGRYDSKFRLVSSP